jgi:hypothetical protein
VWQFQYLNLLWTVTIDFYDKRLVTEFWWPNVMVNKAVRGVTTQYRLTTLASEAWGEATPYQGNEMQDISVKEEE